MRKSRFVILVILCSMLAGCVKSMADEAESFMGYHQQEIGRSARDLLTAGRFRSLKIEMQYMPGNEPKQEAIAELKDFLQQYLNKPDGITVTLSEIPASLDSILNLREIKAIEKVHRKSYTTDNELVVYVLFTNGYSTNQNELGYAYQNTSAVLFGKHLAKNSGKFKKPSRSDLESRVLQHEFGHLLGLVNVGATPQNEHQDHDNGKHCKNRWCLMYHLTDTDDYPSFLLKKDPPKLDKDCIADLKAMGGK